MSTETKQKNGILAIFKSIFSSETDIEKYDDTELTPELKKALESIDTKSAEEYVQGNNSSSKKGGFTKKIDPKIEAAMREKHDQIAKEEPEGREER